MILDLPKYTQEEYNSFISSKFYEKPGIPQIELDLREFQKKILIDNDWSVLPAFKQTLSVYAKSLLLKRIKGGVDYIQPEVVEVLADKAAENFLKRYFRNEEPIIGASFAGILQFKVQEVLSDYFKRDDLYTGISLDVAYGNGDDEKSNRTLESSLSFKAFTESQNEELDLDFLKERILQKIDSECELLDKIPGYTNLSQKFLKFLIYVYILQTTRPDKRLSVVTKQVEQILVDDEKQLNQLIPIMESALLDVQIA